MVSILRIDILYIRNMARSRRKLFLQCTGVGTIVVTKIMHCTCMTIDIKYLCYIYQCSVIQLWRGGSGEKN